jgi:hypothetical protein
MDYNRFYEETKINGVYRSTFKIDHPDGFINSYGEFIPREKGEKFNQLVKKFIDHVEYDKFLTRAKDEYKTYCEKYPNGNNEYWNWKKFTMLHYVLTRNWGAFYVMIKNKRIYYCLEILRKPAQYLRECVNTKIEKDGCREIIIPGDYVFPKEEIDEDINEIRSKASYYSDWRNQFHSPSGFERYDYKEWKYKAKKYGIKV